MAAKSLPLLAALLLVVTFERCAVAYAGLPGEFDLRFGPAITGVGRPLRDSLDRSTMSLDLGTSLRLERPASRWGIQVEIQYTARSRNSREYTDPLTTVNGEHLRLSDALVVNSLQGAILARTTFHRDRKLRPYTLAGPYAAWRIFSTIPGGFSPGLDPVDPTNVRARHTGVIAGFGVDFVPAHADRLSLEVRCSQGLSNVLTNFAGLSGSFRALTIQLAFAPFAHRD